MGRSVETSSWADFLTASTGVSTLIALLCLAKLQASYFPTLPRGACHCIMVWCWLHSKLMWWHHWLTWGNWERWRHSEELDQGAIHCFQGHWTCLSGGGVIGPFTHYQLYSSHLPCSLECADNSICGSYDMAVLSGYPFKLLDCQLDANPNVQVNHLNSEFKYVPRSNEALGHLDLLRERELLLYSICIYKPKMFSQGELKQFSWKSGSAIRESTLFISSPCCYIGVNSMKWC